MKKILMIMMVLMMPFAIAETVDPVGGFFDFIFKKTITFKTYDRLENVDYSYIENRTSILKNGMVLVEEYNVDVRLYRFDVREYQVTIESFEGNDSYYDRSKAKLISTFRETKEKKYHHLRDKHVSGLSMKEHGFNVHVEDGIIDADYIEGGDGDGKCEKGESCPFFSKVKNNPDTSLKKRIKDMELKKNYEKIKQKII